MIDFESSPTNQDPLKLINDINHVRRQHDSKTLIKMLEKITKEEAVVWDDETIGFGQYKYLYKTGKTGNWPIISFTPSLQNISIHVMPGLDKYATLINYVGRVKFEGSTLILHKFSDINLPSLEALLKKIHADISN